MIKTHIERNLKIYTMSEEDNEPVCQGKCTLQFDDVCKGCGRKLNASNIARKALSGNSTLSAPFPGIGQPWTQEKKDELAKVLKNQTCCGFCAHLLTPSELESAIKTAIKVIGGKQMIKLEES